MVLMSSTFSIRLSNALRARLERTAKIRDASVNAVIVELLEQYYAAAGFPSGTDITTRSGRRISVRIRDDYNHAPGLPHCIFYLDDAVTEKEIASYTIGCSQQLLDRFNVHRDDQYKVAAELGLALLQYFNKAGVDITRLEWDQFPAYPDRRVLNTKDLRTTTGVYMLSVEDFVKSMRDAVWEDMHLEYNELRTLYTVKGHSQGYFADQEVFDHSGNHIGHIHFDSDGMRVLYTLDGDYLCHIWYNRLLKSEHPDQVPRQIQAPKQSSGIPTAPDKEPPMIEAPKGFTAEEVSLS
jgi:hypothetical protein